MNPDWLEDCAEGRDILFSLLLPVGFNKVIMSVLLCQEKVEATPKTKSWEKLGTLFKKLGM